MLLYHTMFRKNVLKDVPTEHSPQTQETSNYLGTYWSSTNLMYLWTPARKILVGKYDLGKRGICYLVLHLCSSQSFLAFPGREEDTIPHRHWSQVALDFITDLSDSEGKMMFLVVIDHFFRSLHLIPLPRLPAAFELAEHLFFNTYSATLAYQKKW